MAKDYVDNKYLSLGINKDKLIKDVGVLYNKIEMTIMDKKYNSSKNAII